MNTEGTLVKERKRYMGKDLLRGLAVFAIIFTLSIVIIPYKTVHADIQDGTYEINYEMKESGNDNTSIADGYFSKPATLTVTDGVQYIQLTVTSSSMIKSLDAPSGPVEIVSEDEGNETRTVRFRVDGDLSEPVPMDMHVVVPDLYDMEHTARAVFDVSGLEAESEAETEEAADEDNDSETEDAENTDDDIDENQGSEDESNSESSEEKEEKEENTDDHQTDENDPEEDIDPRQLEDKALDSHFDQQTKSVKADNDTSVWPWIVGSVVGIVIVGSVIWFIRKKK